MDFVEIKNPLDIRVVLVRPIYERNVGSTSRAMSNMGFNKLILIDPCQLTYEAQKSAATGQFALQNHIVYKSWQEFFAGEPQGLRLAFTAKDGRRRAVENFKDVLLKLPEQSPYFSKDSEPVIIHLFFGPEDWGLSQEDIENAHHNCSLPTYGENSSLNLAQAVLIALFILRDTWGGIRTTLDGQQPARSERQVPQGVFPDQTLQKWLEEMGFNVSSKGVNAFTVLKRLMLQNTPTPKEFQMLETVLQQSIRKLHEYNELRKTNAPN